jgi:GT2 family glycosyltransferase
MDIIIPCWIVNEELLELTRNTIYSLKGNKIIIIDNASTMGTGELREFADIYIRNKNNLGYAIAVNQGLKLSGEIVCVANNDIRVSKNWEEVALGILKDDSVGSIHFRMIPYDQPFNPGSDVWKSGHNRWCSSSFFVMRNRLLFDENFKNGVEDWDYWKRFRELGYITTYTNKAEYQHKDSSSQQILPSNTENQKKNVEYFISKWGTTPEEDFEKLYPKELSLPWKPMP